MIRKLKQKFVLVNMLSVGAILLIVFCIITVTSYQRQQDEIQKALSDTLAEGDKKVAPKFQIGAHDDKVHFQNYAAFLVSISPDGTTTSFLRDSVEIEKAVLNLAISIVQNSPKSFGRIPSLNLQYATARSSEGIKIAFVDTSLEEESFQHLLFILGLSSTLGLLLFLLLSIKLANLSIKPVETAWQQQRQFIADASHELKTPLTVILANTGIMLNHPQDKIEHQKKWLNYIKEEADHMKKLIEDMLFLAKSDDGKSVIPMSELNFSDLTYEVLLPFESIAFEKSQHLESAIQENLYLSGNPSQLKELISILLDNACKYTPEGEKISLQLKKEHDKIILTVSNSGSFIPAEAQAHLFERFYRPDQSRTLETGGYGLGLAIAKSITSLHKGSIHLQSSPREGTSFQVIFSDIK